MFFVRNFKYLLAILLVALMAGPALAVPFSRSPFACEITMDPTSVARHGDNFAHYFVSEAAPGVSSLGILRDSIWYNEFLQEVYLGNLAPTPETRRPNRLRAPNFFTNGMGDFVPGNYGRYVFNSGMAVQGQLSHVMVLENQLAFVKFHGPTQLMDRVGDSFEVLPRQSEGQHPGGFSSPVGPLIGFEKPLYEYSLEELAERRIEEGQQVSLRYESGIQVTGTIEEIQTFAGRPVVIRFVNKSARMKIGSKTLFAPSWGVFDLLLGLDGLAGLDRNY